MKIMDVFFYNRYNYKLINKDINYLDVSTNFKVTTLQVPLT